MTTSTYFEMQEDPKKEICFQLRDVIITNNPGIQEEMRGDVPAYTGESKYIATYPIRKRSSSLEPAKPYVISWSTRLMKLTNKTFLFAEFGVLKN